MTRGLRENEGQSSKTAGQIAYEAAGDWVIENPGASSQRSLPGWETLDARASEYWDRIGAAVRAPIVTAIGTIAREHSGSRAPRMTHESIRGLWWPAR